MWKLAPPSCDRAAEQLESALTYANGRKKYRYSDKQRTRLLAVYQNYTAGLGRPAQALIASHLGVRFLEALRTAYDEVQDGRRLAALRNQLKLSVLKCPFCGFGEVRDLDHHLPRSKYPALSICPRNLIPCCHTCNNKKRAVADIDPDSQFPHMYLDAFPVEQFLFATVDVSRQGLVAQFFVQQSQGMSADLFARLGFHLARLDLVARYQPEVTTFVTNLRTSIEDAGADGEIGVRDFLSRCVQRSIQDYGLNHWQTALLVALGASDAFCQGGYVFCFGSAAIGA